jgi:hypothetical protein
MPYVRFGALGNGEIDDEFGSGGGQLIERIAAPQGGYKRHIGGGFNSLDGFGAHAPVGAKDSHTAGSGVLFGHAFNPTVGPGTERNLRTCVTSHACGRQ